MLIAEKKLLAPFTTFGIGGPARWFVEAASEDEIVEAVQWARERGAPLFVLGGGSNLLVSDAGFDGLVLRIGLRGIAVEAVESEGECAEEHTSGAKAPVDPVCMEVRAEALTYRVGAGKDAKNKALTYQIAGGEEVQSASKKVKNSDLNYQVAAGEDWDQFVERTVRDSCAGLECLAGIPGTVGGTPVQNVGAYGQEVASAIEWVRAFDLEQEKFVEFAAAECGFSYRRSRFNTVDQGRFIVTRVDYRLKIGGAPTLAYAELERAVREGRPEGEAPSLVEVAAVVRRIRQAKGMLLVEGDPDCRSAGSFFKNPVVSEDEVRRIAECSGKEPPRFPAGGGRIGNGEGAGGVADGAGWIQEGLCERGGGDFFAAYAGAGESWRRYQRGDSCAGCRDQ